MADSSGESTQTQTPGTNDTSRTSSKNQNEPRHAQPRARHNVKFFVQTPEEDEIQVPSDSDDITNSDLTATVNEEWARKKDAAALSAHDKARQHHDKVSQRYSASSSTRNSTDKFITSSPASSTNSPHMHGMEPSKFGTYALQKLNRLSDMQSPVEPDDSDEDKPGPSRVGTSRRSAAEQKESQSPSGFDTADRLESGGVNLRSGWATPIEEKISDDYVPRPQSYQPSFLGQLLSAHNISLHEGTFRPKDQFSQIAEDDYLLSKLAAYSNPATDPRKQQADFFSDRSRMPNSPPSHSGIQTPSESTAVGSGVLTPNRKIPKWYKESGQWHYTPTDHGSQSPSKKSISKLFESSLNVATAPATPATSKRSRPALSRGSSATSVVDLVNPVSLVKKMNSSHAYRKEAEKRREAILSQCNDRLISQEYLIQICRQLMRVGAPTHRLEDLMLMASRKLRVKAFWQYLPSVMLVSFDDEQMHISQVKLIKEPTCLDLKKLLDTVSIYKCVIHSQMSAQEAILAIKELEVKKPCYNNWTLILAFGVATVGVSPWAFGARPQDFLVAFPLGVLLGTIQVFWAARSPQFSFISETFGTFITSFLARGFSSILTSSGRPMFCLSALAQSSIALILPGWIILSAALELQSRNIIAGSIRLVYAIAYTLFLSFGTVFGLLTFGMMYPRATNDLTCDVPDYWRLDNKLSPKFVYINLPFVALFSASLAVVNQASAKQIPMMVLVSLIGYLANYFSSLAFVYSPIANGISAFAIGATSHIYSRIFRGVQASCMLPAIFVLVPSGVASTNGLSAGLTVANDQRFNSTTSSASASAYSGTIFNAGASMIQVAVSISVGLFLSTLIFYPLGKKRSGIFSF